MDGLALFGGSTVYRSRSQSALEIAAGPHAALLRFAKHVTAAVSRTHLAEAQNGLDATSIPYPGGSGTCSLRSYMNLQSNYTT